jgi:hypothetical protein
LPEAAGVGAVAGGEQVLPGREQGKPPREAQAARGDVVETRDEVQHRARPEQRGEPRAFAWRHDRVCRAVDQDRAGREAGETLGRERQALERLLHPGRQGPDLLRDRVGVAGGGEGKESRA